jgi:hypothetical protein
LVYCLTIRTTLAYCFSYINLCVLNFTKYGYFLIVIKVHSEKKFLLKENNNTMGLSAPMTCEIVENCMPVLIYGLWCLYMFTFGLVICNNIGFMLLVERYLDICKLRDCLFLKSSVFKVVSKSWNTSFCWLFNLGIFESARLLFLSCCSMSMEYLLDLILICFLCGIMWSYNCLFRMLFIYLEKRYMLVILLL